MTKRILVSLLTLALIFTSFALPATNVQAASDSSYKGETVLLSGIMEDFSLSKLQSTKSYVSRQQFAKMLVNASTYQGQVETSIKTSLYKDVSYKNKYAGYIKVAVEQGWMSATITGKFNPSSKITTKDAAKALLGLLGYESSDFSGNLVNAQMAKFNALDLNDNVEKTKNQTLTFSDCTNLFYNLLTAKTKAGAVYGSSVLDVTMNTNGEVDYLSLLKTSLEGPILMTSSLSKVLPFSTKSASIYLNEEASSASSINPYDIIYYSKELNTVWAYNTKVSGVLTNVSPNRTSPTSITIGNDTYTLGNKDMVYAFSSLGDFPINSAVTLFLGMDDEVVAALGTSDYGIDSYGVVTETGSYANASSDNTNDRYFTMVTANANSTTYYYDSSDLTLLVGDLVHVSYASSGQTIEKITQSYFKLANTTVNASTRKIGSYKVAEDAVIVDIHDTSYQSISLDKINGITLTYTNVLYYAFNDADEITSLILEDTINDDYTYGVITSLYTSGTTTTYSYLVDGATKTVSASLVANSPVAGVGVRVDTYTSASGSVSSVSFTALEAKTVTSLTAGSITTAEWTKTLASNASIYYKDSSGSFQSTTLSKVSNLNKYKLTAYYDNSTGVSKQVCIIIAQDK
ncbi:MAG: hypothetical protein PWP24_1096 [Clostridiales bacterium]|nr:hypothetical protein [Clostridiales bacterium]